VPAEISASHAPDVLALERVGGKVHFPLVFPNIPVSPLIALRILWAAPVVPLETAEKGMRGLGDSIGATAVNHFGLSFDVWMAG
jgi:hypothetical protein